MALVCDRSSDESADWQTRQTSDDSGTVKRATLVGGRSNSSPEKAPPFRPPPDITSYFPFSLGDLRTFSFSISYFFSHSPFSVFFPSAHSQCGPSQDRQHRIHPTIYAITHPPSTNILSIASPSVTLSTSFCSDTSPAAAIAQEQSRPYAAQQSSPTLDTTSNHVLLLDR